MVKFVRIAILNHLEFLKKIILRMFLVSRLVQSFLSFIKDINNQSTNLVNEEVTAIKILLELYDNQYQQVLLLELILVYR